MQKEFLEELKVQLKDISDTNENIKRRATQMVSFIGIIIAAATGLGLDSTWKDGLESTWAVGMMVLLLASTAILGATLWMYYKVIKTRPTTVPLVSKKLICVCDGDVSLSEVYRKITGKEPRLYYEFMSRSYLESIKDNEEINEDMADRFNRATRLFVIGVFAYAAWALVGIGL
ncbi:MAG: hypothetical protein MPJ08_01100 [Nitrosopumilus sp.]|nr:hypothetical protein [Nitrosopumilus sp.]